MNSMCKVRATDNQKRMHVVSEAYQITGGLGPVLLLIHHPDGVWVDGPTSGEHRRREPHACSASRLTKCQKKTTVENATLT